MTILWATDPHLDHVGAPVRAAFLESLRASSPERLIVTGDISTAASFTTDLEAMANAAAAPVYYVLGNHDHFGASVGAVRDAATALAARRPDIQWLPPLGVVTLSSGEALVGVDGWADGRVGDPFTTPLVLNDDRLIAELAAQPGRHGRIAVKQALASADADRLESLLHRAAAVARRILVATHVPPFIEALPTHGRLADPAWRPLLISGATGAVLRHFAETHPEHALSVICGHTHVEWSCEITNNLSVRVGGARYGAPRFVRL